jgi:hypothetical protein
MVSNRLYRQKTLLRATNLSLQQNPTTCNNDVNIMFRTSENIAPRKISHLGKYRDVFSRLADNRDDNYLEKAIAAGYLAMREPINI